MALCSCEKHKGAQLGREEAFSLHPAATLGVLSVTLADILLGPPLALRYRTKHTMLLNYTLLLSKNT